MTVSTTDLMSDKLGANARSMLGALKNVIAKSACITLLIAVAAQTAKAEEIRFADQTIRVIVGFSPGGHYDSVARLFADHFGRHVPGNPSIIVENMPGAGGYRAAQHIDSVAPKDGTVLYMAVQSVPFDSLIGLAPETDPSKYEWIGRIVSNVSIGSSWHASGVTTFDDLKEKESIFGATGPGTLTDYIPRLMNEYAGTKIQVVPGYQGAANVLLAMETEEVDAHVGSWMDLRNQRSEMIASGHINVLFQIASERISELPNVPTLTEVALDERGKSVFEFIASANVGRSIVAPPGTSPEIVEVLRASFEQTMADPQFIADAAQRNLDIDPATGEAMHDLMVELSDFPEDLRKDLLDIIQAER